MTVETSLIHGIPVAVAAPEALLRFTVRQAAASIGNRPFTLYAIHVGGLLELDNMRYVQAMQRASLVYADGHSITSVLRAAGEREVKATPTTDFGWDVLRGLQQALGRPLRFFVLGGMPGIAQAAAETLEAGIPNAVAVGADHGFHETWGASVMRIRMDAPDVVIVGLGSPREMLWVDAHLPELPPALIMTCGGWLGFLAGQERRAPEWFRRLRLEWAWRLLLDFRRLAPRYVKGALVTFTLAAQNYARRSG